MASIEKAHQADENVRPSAASSPLQPCRLLRRFSCHFGCHGNSGGWRDPVREQVDILRKAPANRAEGRNASRSGGKERASGGGGAGGAGGGGTAVLLPDSLGRRRGEEERLERRPCAELHAAGDGRGGPTRGTRGTQRPPVGARHHEAAAPAVGAPALGLVESLSHPAAIICEDAAVQHGLELAVCEAAQCLRDKHRKGGRSDKASSGAHTFWP